MSTVGNVGWLSTSIAPSMSSGGLWRSYSRNAWTTVSCWCSQAKLDQSSQSWWLHKSHLIGLWVMAKHWWDWTHFFVPVMSCSEPPPQGERSPGLPLPWGSCQSWIQAASVSALLSPQLGPSALKARCSSTGCSDQMISCSTIDEPVFKLSVVQPKQRQDTHWHR